MKKRIISILIVFCLALMLLPTAAFADDPVADVTYAVTGGNLHFDLDTGSILDCDETVTEAVIPAEIDGVAVTVIGREAFAECAALASVTIPDSVTTIEPMAFRGCTALTAVVIPDSVTALGGQGFYRCAALEQVVLSANLTEVAPSLFRECTALRQIAIPDGVTTIGVGAFQGSGLTSIRISANVTTIGITAFASCMNLTEFVIDSGNTQYMVLDGALCTNRDQVALVQYPLGRNARSYAVPEGITWIKDSAFCDATLEEIIIPFSVKIIESYAFAGCSELTDVCYLGSKAEWDAIMLSENNDALRNAKVTFTNPFYDLSRDAYYYQPVLWAVENGITMGMTEDTFVPENSCTRAQVVTFLWRAAGEPVASERETPFTDISADAYYYQPVLWAVENGITTGMTEDTFGPDAPCTRAQVATFLWRAAGEPVPAGTETPFADISADAYYYNAVLWAVENKITTGTTETTFSPDATCTRAQIVTFLYRAEVQ